MATILEETEVKLELADLARRRWLPRTHQPRTPGLHLSGVLKYIAQTSGLTDYVEQSLKESMPLAMACGFMWEEFVASLYVDWVWQPGEATDPVIMTSDGLNSSYEIVGSTIPYAIEEAKWTSATWKGASGILDDWLKLHQARGYCAGYGTSVVRWHFLCVRQPWDPRYYRATMRFDEKEIEKTRAMIVANRERAIEAGYSE